eukprot:350272-Chlamydomonas_euryale.AAC.8
MATPAAAAAIRHPLDICPSGTSDDPWSVPRCNRALLPLPPHRRRASHRSGAARRLIPGLGAAGARRAQPVRVGDASVLHIWHAKQPLHTDSSPPFHLLAVPRRAPPAGGEAQGVQQVPEHNGGSGRGDRRGGLEARQGCVWNWLEWDRLVNSWEMN